MMQTRKRGRRRRNPVLTMRHHRRRRSNPEFLSNLKGMTIRVAYLAGGGIMARSLPQLLVPQYNTGFMGYGMNLLTTAVSAALVGRWKGAPASQDWMLGGFAFTLSRIIDDYAGFKLLTFAQYSPSFQLSGDPHYGMAGVYASASFPLPSSTRMALPPAAPPATEGSVRAMAVADWSGSYN